MWFRLPRPKQVQFSPFLQRKNCLDAASRDVFGATLPCLRKEKKPFFSAFRLADSGPRARTFNPFFAESFFAESCGAETPRVGDETPPECEPPTELICEEAELEKLPEELELL